MRERALFIFVLAVGLMFVTRSVTHGESYDGRTTNRWKLTGIGDGTTAGASITADEGVVRYSYPRGQKCALVHAVPLTGFARLQWEVRSETQMVLVVALRDREGATFHRGLPVPAGQWTTLTATPEEFEANDDSPVKRNHLDSRLLDTGYAMFDLAAIAGGSGSNALWIRRVVVDGAPTVQHETQATASGDLKVDTDVTLATPSRRRGNIFVGPSGHLHVTSDIVLEGDIHCQGGTLSVEGGVLELPQQYPHERTITLDHGARLEVRSGTIRTRVPATLSLRGSQLMVRAGTFDGGFTTDLDESSTIDIAGALSPGEFVIPPRARVDMSDTEGVALWLLLGPPAVGRVTLPPMGRVARWDSAWGLNLHLRNCTVVWCLLSAPGSNAVVEHSDVRAAGVASNGSATATFRDMHNKRRVPHLDLPSVDRHLTFLDTQVTAWTFYTFDRARIVIDGCTYGECMANGESRIQVHNSTCDGSGGYVQASTRSHIDMDGCTLQCLVVASDDAHIVLTGCHVTGDVRATGRSTIELVGCQVTGKLIREPAATLSVRSL